MNLGIWITIISAVILLLCSAVRGRGKQLASVEPPVVTAAVPPEQTPEEFHASPAHGLEEGETA